MDLNFLQCAINQFFMNVKCGDVFRAKDFLHLRQREGGVFPDG